MLDGSGAVLLLQPHRRHHADAGYLDRAAEPGAGEVPAIGVDPVEAGVEVGAAEGAPGTEEGVDGHLVAAPRRGEDRRLHPLRKPVGLHPDLQVDRRLETHRAPDHRVLHRLALHQDGVGERAQRAHVAVGEAAGAVTPELVHAGPQRPPGGEAIAHVHVTAGGAEPGAALARGDPVLQAARWEAVGQGAIGLVELAHLAEGAIGHEVDRVLAVLDRHVKGELAQRIHRVEADEPPAAIGLDGPALAEHPGEGQAAQRGRADVGAVAHREAAQVASPRPGGEAVAQPELGQPRILAPDAGPRGIHPRAPRGAPLALQPERQRSAEHVEAEVGGVGGAVEAVGRGEHRVVEHQAVHARARHAKAEPGVGRLAGVRQPCPHHGLPPQPPGHRQRAGLHDHHLQVGPAHIKLQPEGARQHVGAHEEVLRADHQLVRGQHPARLPHVQGAACRIEDQWHIPRLDHRLQAPVRTAGAAQLGHLQEGGERDQGPLADAIPLHRAARDPAQQQLEDDRVGVAAARGAGGGRREVRVERRRERPPRATPGRGHRVDRVMRQRHRAHQGHVRAGHEGHRGGRGGGHRPVGVGREDRRPKLHRAARTGRAAQGPDRERRGEARGR